MPETSFRQARIDRGTEWKGVWKSNVEDRGARITVGLPGESKTNADAERWIGETERQTAAAMEHANCHPSGWSYAARVFYFNYARTDKSGPTGNTPFYDAWGRDDTRDLFVLGCEVSPLLDPAERNKFQSHGGSETSGKSSLDTAQTGVLIMSL